MTKQRAKFIRETSGWVAFAIVLLWGIAEHNLQRQATISNTEELNRRGRWMQSQDEFRDEMREFVKAIMERHESEDQIKSPDDIPGRFYRWEGDELIKRIEALEAREKN